MATPLPASQGIQYPQYMPLRGVSRTLWDNSTRLARHQVQGDVPLASKTIVPISHGLMPFGQIGGILQGVNSNLKRQALQQLYDLLQKPTNIVRALDISQNIFGDGLLTKTVSEDEGKRSIEESEEKRTERDALMSEGSNGVGGIIGDNDPADGGNKEGGIVNEDDSKTNLGALGEHLPSANFGIESNGGSAPEYLEVRGSGPRYANRLIEDVMEELNNKHDVVCRQLACKCILMVSASSVGLEFMSNRDYYRDIAVLVTSDEDSEVRKYGLDILYNLAQNRPYLARMVAAKALVPTMVSACLRESVDAVQASHFRLLSFVFRNHAEVGANEEVVALLASALSRARSSESLQWMLACVGSVCVLEIGKAHCVEQNILEHLVKNIEHPSEKVRENASSAMMLLTVSRSAKQQSFMIDDCDVLSILWKSRNDKCGVVAANALRVIANLSELPLSRQGGFLDSQHVADELEKIIATHPRDNVRRGAKAALEQIQWRP